jgi:hypothetical protein
MLRREFSWSYTRHRIFERCHRAYYYHYYAAWGGWDKYADEKTNFLYYLKNLQTIKRWTESIFLTILNKAFSERNIESKSLLRSAKSQIYKDIFDMKNNASTEDRKKVSLCKIHYESLTINEVQEEAEKHITLLIAKFAESQALEMLQNINPLAVKNIPRPASFLLNGIKTWTSPDFIWIEKGQIRILNLSFKDPLESETWAFKAAIDVMFAKYIFQETKQPEISSFFLHDKTYPEITITRNKREVKSIIDNSCRNMLELTNLDTNIKEEVFKRTDGDACRHCNFREACLPNSNSH